MKTKYDIIILCSFNSNDLLSTMYDVIHLNMLLKNNKTNVICICDNKKNYENIKEKEEKRLKKKCEFNKVHYIENNIEYKNILDFYINKNEYKNIFLSISCHGYTGIKDYKNNETDGFNEYIKINNTIILDDELYDIIKIYKYNLHILVDTCSSGTMFDLPYVFTNKNNYIKENDNITNLLNQNILCISACKDYQFNRDDISKLGWGGGLTSKFIDNVFKYNYCNICDLFNNNILVSSNICSIPYEI